MLEVEGVLMSSKENTIILNPKFMLGEFVTLSTDEDGYKRVVTGYKVGADRSLLYYVTFMALDSSHYDFELIAWKAVGGCIS